MSHCLNPNCLQPNPNTTIFCQKCGSKLVLQERYFALKILGQGSFDLTFQAFDTEKPSQPYCVIKQSFSQVQDPNAQEKSEELFKQEAIRLKHLGKHQQIPELLDYFIQDHHQYLVQEYIAGQNLAQNLARHGAFSETKIMNLLAHLLPLVGFIHKHNCIHQDIKPENIIKRQGEHKLFLVDFGVSKAITRTPLSVTGTVIGSSGYIAPEQALGKPTFASDLYSLGVTCVHLLTNVEAFDLFDVFKGRWVWRDYLTVPVHDSLGQVLDKLLQQATDNRFQTAQDVLNHLPLKAKPISQPILQRVAEPDIELKSARGINYYHLEQLLKAKNWKEADEETAHKMCEVMGRTEEGWLEEEDIDNFPCEDLRTLDQLWLKYSNGRFGFSVQKEIYQTLGGTRNYDSKIWQAFGDQVGWRVSGNWLHYQDLKFDLRTPRGHLPFLWWGRWLWGVGSGGWRGISSLASRLVDCNL
ncbi:Serine/threonine-protein kinase PknA [Planktothrix tepida]|uniref:non-specific serine/threonine protein kinase n=1 Tax=Planktothrix tepida PCC 9214 TaxID=671072 RepID=A0A1J1LNV5_9CYAN|nr:GUN4 domain-containing protein [Planktothrix tepida]CAD5956374.1 Serine/threonine-protein kinase PknA [Planktothrix tepida]CUR34103.1 Serine/threonine kinase [Planktothrix tepida PCC 9214]